MERKLLYVLNMMFLIATLLFILVTMAQEILPLIPFILYG